MFSTSVSHMHTFLTTILWNERYFKSWSDVTLQTPATIRGLPMTHKIPGTPFLELSIPMNRRSKSSCRQILLACHVHNHQHTQHPGGVLEGCSACPMHTTQIYVVACTVWIVLCALTACNKVGLSLIPLQQGVSVSGGAEAVGHATQAALTTEAAFLTVHQANGFKSVTRSAVPEAVKGIFPSSHHCRAAFAWLVHLPTLHPFNRRQLPVMEAS